MKEYKTVNVDLSDNSTDKPILSEYIKDGWQIHTTYPFAVGLFLLERERINPLAEKDKRYAEELAMLLNMEYILTDLGADASAYTKMREDLQNRG